MIYITGDTHGDFSRYQPFTEAFHPTPKDVVIVLGMLRLIIFMMSATQLRFMHKKFTFLGDT